MLYIIVINVKIFLFVIKLCGLMLKYKNHPPTSQHLESLTSAADVFVLSPSQCFCAGSSQPHSHSPYILQRTQALVSPPKGGNGCF